LRRTTDEGIEGADWAAGLQARTQALLSEGPVAEQCYAEAVQRLGRTELRPELARAHLLFGEWLRRENRRVEARDHLRTAQLTRQEEHIARLARDGRSNTEIGAELFLSARTVEWHLRKVFAKLGITSRKGLQEALSTRSRYTSG
jgi:DNA-binding NarL/FixJ family response regulator